MVAPSQPKAQWTVDPAHSAVEFSVKHMMFTTVKGSFSTYKADLSFDEQEPERSSVEAWVDLASVDTKEPNRDNHLRSADFFDVANHPTMHFKSKAIKSTSKGKYQVDGDLTIRGVTRAVSLEGEYGGFGKDPWGGIRAGVSLQGTVNRKDFGLTWNQVLEAGGVLVGDAIKISIEAELVKQAG
ncbi:MAG: YceI family protein [Chloroflexi bacterium]|nr:YceI family protein [Chloroflexota bacterium]